MRFLLDAKDLIDVVEHGTPSSFTEFGTHLRQSESHLVLTTTNVREFVAPLMEDDDFLKMRSLLQRLETLPICYMREANILYAELSSALQTFQSGEEYKEIDPYVWRWDATLFSHEATTRVLVGYRLDEMIYALWHGASKPLLLPRRTINETRQNILKQRSIRTADRLSPEKNFIAAVGRQLQIGKRFDLVTPSLDHIDLTAFGKWIYAKPARCPGFRLHYHTFHELVANVRDSLQDSDLLDFAHIPAIPYVDAATMDRRMTDHVSRVSRRLAKKYDSKDYSKQIFTKLALLLRVFN